ncbi:hypothetical protein PC121_g2616 [Phytophthora cactorum]|nr:hypothetical protein PC121_g2616 [Phytophthora cactorum]KAG4061126.1 hypothetical protein PC123_g4001 [Phytophthora cactorum]
MPMELKDLAPLLLKKERANGDIDLTVLTNVLRGEKAANDRRKELIKVIEHHPVPSDRDMVNRNHSERYEFGLKKAFHYVKLLQNGNHTDEEQTILLNALGEQVPLDLCSFQLLKHKPPTSSEPNGCHLPRVIGPSVATRRHNWVTDPMCRVSRQLLRTTMPLNSS